MLGQQAPDFTLMASSGLPVTLSRLRGQFVLLVFYPINNTPTCTRQLQDFSRMAADFKDVNACVFGVNPASLNKHQAFCSRHNIQIPVLSDTNGTVAKAYHAYYGWFSVNKRTVVVVDPEGTICYYQRGNPNPEDVLHIIQHPAL